MHTRPYSKAKAYEEPETVPTETARGLPKPDANQTNPAQLIRAHPTPIRGRGGGGPGVPEPKSYTVDGQNPARLRWCRIPYEALQLRIHCDPPVPPQLVQAPRGNFSPGEHIPINVRVDPFSILFNQYSFQKPAVSPGFPEVV